MTTSGPTTPEARRRTALRSLALVLMLLAVLLLITRDLVPAVVLAVAGGLCLVAGARPPGGS